MRSGLTEVGRQEISRSQVAKEEQHKLPNPYETALPLRRAPIDMLREAIDRGIRTGGEAEFLGALSVYETMVGEHQEPLHPEYRALLLDRLGHDDFHSSIYTEGLASTLMLYNNRESVLALMEAAGREKDPEGRNHLVLAAAGMINFDIPISTKTTPVQEQRMLDDFEAWFNANKDRIRFDKRGQPYLAGGEARVERIDLTPEDRARIRKDPLCVLRLTAGMMEGEGEGLPALSEQCGEALLGSEGAALLRDAANQAKNGDGPSPDLQAAMSSARGKYPSYDAVQLAIAYVAAYETDPASQKLARDVLEELGASDMGRVLKGEPREVKKKAEALFDEVFKGGSKD